MLPWQTCCRILHVGFANLHHQQHLQTAWWCSCRAPPPGCSRLSGPVSIIACTNTRMRLQSCVRCVEAARRVALQSPGSQPLQPRRPLTSAPCTRRAASPAQLLHRISRVFLSLPAAR